MEYVEAFYAKEPEIPYLGIPSRLQLPQPPPPAAAAAAAAPAAAAAAPAAAAAAPAPVAAAPAPAAAAANPLVVYRPSAPITAVYPLARLPTEEELAASAAHVGSAFFTRVSS